MSKENLIDLASRYISDEKIIAAGVFEPSGTSGLMVGVAIAGALGNLAGAGARAAVPLAGGHGEASACVRSGRPHLALEGDWPCHTSWDWPRVAIT